MGLAPPHQNHMPIMEPTTLGQLATPYGTANVVLTNYRTKGEPIAIVLDDADDGECIAILSVNLPDAQYKLLPNEFFVKTWTENEKIVKIALESGLFEDTGIKVSTGRVEAPVWRIKK